MAMVSRILATVNEQTALPAAFRWIVAVAGSDGGKGTGSFRTNRPVTCCRLGRCRIAGKGAHYVRNEAQAVTISVRGGNKNAAA